MSSGWGVYYKCVNTFIQVKSEDERAASPPLQEQSECDHVFRKELYGNRVMRKYTKRQRSTLYGEDKEGRVQVSIRYSRAGHNRGIASQANDEAGRKRGREELVVIVKGKKALRNGVHVRREYVGGGTGKEMSGDYKEQGSDLSGATKVTSWRNFRKPRETGFREEETTIGREEGELSESRRKMKQCKGKRKRERHWIQVKG